MNQSAIRTLADRARRRPEWLERDGDHNVLVRGYSPIDSLAYGALAAALILAPIVIFIVSYP